MIFMPSLTLSPSLPPVGRQAFKSEKGTLGGKGFFFFINEQNTREGKRFSPCFFKYRYLRPCFTSSLPSPSYWALLVFLSLRLSTSWERETESGPQMSLPERRFMDNRKSEERRGRGMSGERERGERAPQKVSLTLLLSYNWWEWGREEEAETALWRDLLLLDVSWTHTIRTVF